MIRAAVVRDGRTAAARAGAQPRQGQPGPDQPVAAAPAARACSASCARCCSRPEDLALVKGDPSERRRFLDDLLVAARAAAGRRALRLRPGAQAAQHPAEVRRAGPSRVGLPGRRPVHARRVGPAPRARRRASCSPQRLRPDRRARGRYVGKAYEHGRAAAASRDDADSTTSPPSSWPSTRRRRAAERTTLSEQLMARARPTAPQATRSSAASRWSARTATTWCSRWAGATAGEGLRLPRRVLVVRAGAAAGVVRPAARDGRRPDAGPRRRLRRARRRAAAQLAELVAGAEQVLVTAAVRRRRAGGAGRDAVPGRGRGGAP